jgi:hypothetical protein
MLVGKVSPGESGTRLRLNEDETAITTNTTRVEKEKQETTVIRETSNRSLRSFKVTEEIKIRCIRLRQTDSADLVFSSVENRDRAREHPRWLTLATPEARMRGEQRHPVNYDTVTNDVVMDLEKDDSKTLRPGLLSEFNERNSTDAIDCTARKATWLSKRQQGKKIESLVIWLKQPAAAEHLMRQGTTLFGASGPYSSKSERRNGFDLCYNPDRYGHKQVTCTHPTQCGICYNPRNARNCSKRATPRCPICRGDHAIFDRESASATECTLQRLGKRGM